MKNFLKHIVLIAVFCTAGTMYGLRGNEIIALLGDSMTWIGGNNCEKETGWSHYLKSALPSATVMPYARSGATWTNTSQTKGDVDFYTEVLDPENVVINQVYRLINATAKNPGVTPDIVVLFAGGNDSWFESKRPGMMQSRPLPEVDLDSLRPSMVTNLNASVEYGCRLLQRHFPKSRLVLVTPLQMSRVSAAQTHRVGDVIEGVGKRLGIEVLRPDYNVAITHDGEKTKKHRYTYDGVHTNPAGAKMLAAYILEALQASKCSAN